MNQIIFQDINNEFAYGQFLNLTVIIMKSNGYVNASKLCNEGGKLFNDWSRLKSTREYIDYLKKSVYGISRTPVIEVLNIENNLKGTYINEDLITDIAGWISVEFKYKVSQIVKNYAISQFQQQLTEKDEIITQSNDIIETKSENYVPLLRNEKDPIFVVNRIAEKTINFRCIQKRSYKRHTNEILYLETPNAKNILNRLKERIPFKYFTLILSDTFTEQQLIDIINEVNDEKYE